MRHDFVIAMKAVIIRDEHVLVLRRSAKEIASSRMGHREPWDFPGGSIHFSESTMTGLQREIREETGLQVSMGEPISVFDVIKNQIHLCIITCSCQWMGQEVQLSEEHEDFFWVTKNEIENMDLPRWMKRDIFRGFNMVDKSMSFDS